MARDIEQITPFTALEDSVVRNAGVEALPNSPSSAGIRASELKRRFYQPLEEVRDDIDDRFTKINSNFTEIDEDLTTLEGLAFDKANIEQEVSTSTTKVPSSNLLKTQLDLKVSKAGAENITGIKTYKSGATPLIEDAPSSNTMAANKAYVDTMIPLTAIKTAISETPLDTNLLSEKFINTTYATKSDIASVFEYKGTVADYTALSAITGQGVGDTYNMTASYLNTPAGTNWAWNGTSWDALGGDIIIETAQSTSAVKVPSTNLLTQSSFARVYRNFTDINAGYSCDTPIETVIANMAVGSYLIADTVANGSSVYPSTFGILEIAKHTAGRVSCTFTRKQTDNTVLRYVGSFLDAHTPPWSGWKQVLTSPDSIETTQSTSTVKVPSSKLLKESSFARVYREATEITGITYPVAIGVLCKALSDGNLLNTYMVIGCSAATETKITGLPVIGAVAQTYGQLIIRVPGTSAFRMDIEYTRHIGNGTADIKWIGDLNRGTNPWTVNWHMVIDDNSAQTISAVKTYSASPIVPTTPSGPSAAVAKSYVDGLIGFARVYDKIISNQTEFEALIGDPNGTWLGAVSVALVGQFALSTANNSGIEIPATVKQIHGFNGAKITITNFVYNATTALGGLWCYTRPTTLDYSIRDLEVDCTGTGTVGDGFRNCTNLTNCTGTGTGTGTYGIGYGFGFCTNLTNCTGTGTGAKGYGFYNGTNLTNCTGKGAKTGTGEEAVGYGFYNITTASNCSDGGSSTAMWGGTNNNIDIDTCRKTPVAVTSGELTTLNT